MAKRKSIIVILDKDCFKPCLHTDEELNWMIKNTGAGIYSSHTLFPHGILSGKQFDEFMTQNWRKLNDW